MTKRSNIIIVAMLLFSILSIMLIVFIDKAHEDFRNDITISASGVTEKTLQVRDLQLSPTEQTTFDVGMTCAASGSYNISLDYIEQKDGGMKHFINVVVKCNGEVVYEGNLLALLDENEIVSFESVLEEKAPCTITITYEMPITVGNEAQGTSADFDILLRIEKV